MLRRFTSTSSLVLLGMLALAGCETYGPVGVGEFSTIIVDPGHGGHDFGGRAMFGRNEKDLALDTAQRLKANLDRRGFRVIITRNADYFITLGQRVDVSNGTPGCIFVSIHYNWDRGRSGHGVETYYYMPRAVRLAANVDHALAAAYGTRDRGVKHRGFYVLRKNRRPAILVECGFVSNRSDNAIAQSASGRQRIADAIALGIVAERKGQRP
ncbi:MAG: N-acetylmuramoyl-L-alanine amidase [Terrimicrobiaceae bacterium]|nr:N-acetylmuramoyl-L-alanine amidase [Terrimicrobiaceae bacterium]